MNNFTLEDEGEVPEELNFTYDQLVIDTSVTFYFKKKLV
jgi:hypothetical protein